MTIRWAVAVSRGEALGSLRAAAARSIAWTGSATWGLGAGLRIRKDFRRWVKGKSRSEPAPSRRGSGYPSSKGLCHATQGFFDSLGSNLPTFPKESSTSPGGKSQEELAADRGCGFRAAMDPFHSWCNIVATSASWCLERQYTPLHHQVLPAQCQNHIGELRRRWAGTLPKSLLLGEQVIKVREERMVVIKLGNCLRCDIG